MPKYEPVVSIAVHKSLSFSFVSDENPNSWKNYSKFGNSELRIIFPERNGGGRVLEGNQGSLGGFQGVCEEMVLHQTRGSERIC